MKKEPFKTVFIHGLVRDISGKKMSKSLGNVIDPLDVIEHAGADALRFALVSLVVGQGQDVKLTEDKISEARGFVIKIWNAARFVLMQEAKSGKTAAENTVFDRWIISRYNKTVKEVSELLDAFEIGAASQRLYQFIWSDFCDWYIEFSKLSPNFKVLEQIILGSLKLLHPFMPFMTEEINCRLRGGEGGALEYRSIMIQTWPKADAALIDDKLENEMGTFMEVVVALRRIRAKHHIPYSTEISGVIVSEEKFDIPTIKRIIRASSLEVVSRLKEEIPHAAAEQTPKAKIFIRL